MTQEIKLILLCRVAILVICAAKNPDEYGRGKQLNESELNVKYKFDDKLHGFGAHANAYLGTTKTKPVEKVVMKKDKEEPDPDDPPKPTEVTIYQYLHEKYGDLVQYHLINMYDYVQFKDSRRAIILTQTGPDLKKAIKKFRKEPGNQPDWKMICKLMIHMLDAVEYLHRVDVAHLDIYNENIVFGLESAPVNGSRLPGVTYKDEFYLIDLDEAKVLTKRKDGRTCTRYLDLECLGNLLCWILTQEQFNELQKLKQSFIKTYVDTDKEFKDFTPEIRAGLVGYHQELRGLADRSLTDGQLKTAIDYEKLRSYFKSDPGKCDPSEPKVDSSKKKNPGKCDPSEPKVDSSKKKNDKKATSKKKD